MTSPKGEYPPAPPPITRDDSRLTAEEVRARLDAMREVLNNAKEQAK